MGKDARSRCTTLTLMIRREYCRWKRTAVADKSWLQRTAVANNKSSWLQCTCSKLPSTRFLYSRPLSCVCYPPLLEHDARCARARRDRCTHGMKHQGTTATQRLQHQPRYIPSVCTGTYEGQREKKKKANENTKCNSRRLRRSSHLFYKKPISSHHPPTPTPPRLRWFTNTQTNKHPPTHKYFEANTHATQEHTRTSWPPSPR